MSLSSRNKGKRGEQQAVELLRRCGIPARRGVQYGGGGDAPDVAHALDPILHIEVKLANRVTIEEWYDQALVDGRYRVPVVLHRRTKPPGMRWVATTMLRDLATLLDHPDPSIFEVGDERYIHSLVRTELRNVVSLEFIRRDALRFDQQFLKLTARDTPGRAPGMAHARLSPASPWMVSLYAEDFLEIALQQAMERFDFPPAAMEDGLAPRFEGEVERYYRSFWEGKRLKIADLLPLFRSFT